MEPEDSSVCFSDTVTIIHGLQLDLFNAKKEIEKLKLQLFNLSTKNKIGEPNPFDNADFTTSTQSKTFLHLTSMDHL
jgi:hypothetical protein